MLYPPKVDAPALAATPGKSYLDPAGRAARQVLLDVGADDTARNEAAVALRRAKYAGLADDLVRVLDNPEERERFRAFAMQHLGETHRNFKSPFRALTGVRGSSIGDVEAGGNGKT